MSIACVFSVDDAYVMPFQVFFHSLHATSSIPLEIDLFILHTNNLSHASIRRLTEFLRRYGRQATFLDASLFIPACLPVRPSDHVSPATFYRLFIDRILPAEIDQVVYLDVDMLALKSIARLFDEPVSKLVAAADHCTPANEIRLWGEMGGSYFQAGVLKVPLNVWREQKITNEFIQVMASPDLQISFWDQDILNIVLRDQWQRIPVWYNVSQALVSALPQVEIEKNARIIHFTGRQKPWNHFYCSAFTAQWDAAYAESFDVSFDRAALKPSRLDRLKSSLLDLLNA